MDEKTPAGLPKAEDATESRRRTFCRVLILFVLVYGFLLSIKMMGGGLKLVAKEHEADIQGLVKSVSANPVMALFIGMVITAVVQSSSFTTALLVTLVADGVLTVGQAIPLVMGANMGTTITNTLVSLGHLSRRDEFRRAFSGAVVHDIFNLLCVAILFPIEMVFHPLQRAVMALVPSGIEKQGEKMHGVLDYICKPVCKQVEYFFTDVCQFGTTTGGAVVGIGAALLLFVCLFLMVKQLRVLVVVRLERFFDKVLFRNGAISFTLGLFLTLAAQSSSVTTSMVVPLLGAGLLSLEQIFPYTVGANIGTTITGLLAALAKGKAAGFQIALVHTFFNCLGAAIFLPLKFIPISIARHLGRKCEKHRWYAIVHLVIVFVVIPAIAITLGHLLGVTGGLE